MLEVCRRHRLIVELLTCKHQFLWHKLSALRFQSKVQHFLSEKSRVLFACTKFINVFLIYEDFRLALRHVMSGFFLMTRIKTSTIRNIMYVIRTRMKGGKSSRLHKAAKEERTKDVVDLYHFFRILALIQDFIIS